MIVQVNITVDAETEALPTDFLQIRDFYILSGQTKTPLSIYNTSIKWTQLKGHQELVCQLHIQF